MPATVGTAAAGAVWTVMRPILAFAVVLALLVPGDNGVAAEIASCFTPGGDCIDVIVAQVGAARQQVLVQAYSFTSSAVVRALIDAKRRGVDVRAILDKSNVCRDEDHCTKKSAIAADSLVLARVPVLVDFQHPIAHNKIIVIDGVTGLTGSYNFSAQAERNAENLLVINDAALARRYAANWQAHAGHSEPYR